MLSMSTDSKSITTVTGWTTEAFVKKRSSHLRCLGISNLDS